MASTSAAAASSSTAAAAAAAGTCDWAPFVDPEEISGWKLEDFELLQTLGTGTFGRVRLSLHTPTKKYYAIKIMKKALVVQLKQVDHVKNEKHILQEVDHPYITHLYKTFQTDTRIYLVFEFVAGGEMFTHLRKAQRFPEDVARIYAAEITSVFEHLHSKHIIYRDLKPENILFGNDGHARLTDFGFAKVVEDRTFTLCGTPEYLAPEIIQNQGHNRGVDWWALGILIYEMLVGYPPFIDESPFRIYEKILEGKIHFPKFVDPVARDLIKRLLTADRTKRLGLLKDGAEDVKRHRWFASIDWDALLARKVPAPIPVRIGDPKDAIYFERYRESIGGKDEALPAKYAEMFNDF